MAFKHSAKVLSSVPKHKKIVMCLTEKIHVLRQALLRHELQCCWLSLTKSTIWYIQQKEEEIHQSAHNNTPESTKVTSSVCDDAMEKQLNLWTHEMMTNKKKHSGWHCAEAESQRNLQSCKPETGTLNASQPVQTGLHVSEDNTA